MPHLRNALFRLVSVALVSLYFSCFTLYPILILTNQPSPPPVTITTTITAIITHRHLHRHHRPSE
jgi:hypothetical protein